MTKTIHKHIKKFMWAKKCIAGFIRCIFALMSMLPQKKVIAFLSRQSSRPFDFQLLAPELQRHFPGYDIHWACVPQGGKLGVGLFLRQLFFVATAHICFTDGYVPAVSIPTRHRGSCIQLWHASGAVKKFGYQCLDTPAGRNSKDAAVFRMHKGYDWVVAGMPGAKDAFTEAFGVRAEKILPLGLPRHDYLLADAYAEQRAEDAQNVRAQLGISAKDGRLVVLYAPTFRKGNCNPAWLQDNVKALSRAFAGKNVLLVLAGHPLDKAAFHSLSLEGAPVAVLRGPTIKALGVADVVVSDYSAVTLDAGLAGKPVLFFVPDIEEYRRSPGLNVDPVVQFPNAAFIDAEVLAQVCLSDDFDASQNVVNSFMEEYAGSMEGSHTAAIVDFVSGIISTELL